MDKYLLGYLGFIFSFNINAQVLTLDPVVITGTNYQVLQVVTPKSFNNSVHVQETSPGMTSPYIGAFTGNQVDQSINGIRMNNALFRTGPNQYYSWIPDAFVNSIGISDGGNVGGTISRELGVANTHIGTSFNSGNNSLTESASFKNDKFGFAVNNINTSNAITANGTIPNSSYNQKAIMGEANWNIRNKTTLVYSESNDIPRTDRMNGGYTINGYQKPANYVYDLQRYTYLNHKLDLDSLQLNFGFQNNEEHITDGTRRVKSNLNAYTINAEYWLNNAWSVYSTNTLETIVYENGLTIATAKDNYTTNKQGVRWNNNIGPLDVSTSIGAKEVSLSGVDPFFGIEGSAIVAWNGFFTSFDHSINAPSYTMIKQSATTGKGLSLPNPNLVQEEANTFRVGYKANGLYFDIYNKILQNAFYSMLVDKNTSTYTTINSGSVNVRGSTLGYKNTKILDSKFGIDSRLEYAEGTQVINGVTDVISKVPQFIGYTKINYAGAYIEGRYQPKDNRVSTLDNLDVRMYDFNKGYKILNIGYTSTYEKLDYTIALNNVFNDNGRVLGSSTDVLGRALFASVKYSF